MILSTSVIRFRAAGIVCLACAMALFATGEALGQATPAAELDIPLPRECTIEPRGEILFPPELSQRPPATPAPVVTDPAPPFVPPAGEPADTDTVSAVTATVREAIACRNANDFLRAYALYTDNMLLSLFGGPSTIDPEIQAAIAERPAPLPRRDRVALRSVSDIVLLPDGRAGAIVETLTAQRAFRDYLTFEQDSDSGRWLIDETRVMGDG